MNGRREMKTRFYLRRKVYCKIINIIVVITVFYNLVSSIPIKVRTGMSNNRPSFHPWFVTMIL